MWGIIPAAGSGTRMQPLAFSKELLPVGSWFDENGVERPRAVSEYLVERMLRAGVRKICFVISPWKSDILQYYGGAVEDAHVVYACQAQAAGLCDAIFHALPVIPRDEPVLIGLPDTIWFPSEALAELPSQTASFLLFPVERPELFDAVVLDDDGYVKEIQVKRSNPATQWIWGALSLPGSALHDLHGLWLERDRCDEYLGSLINAWIDRGGVASGFKFGTDYVDGGTVQGYREAIRLLAEQHRVEPKQRKLENRPRLQRSMAWK